MQHSGHSSRRAAGQPAALGRAQHLGAAVRLGEHIDMRDLAGLPEHVLEVLPANLPVEVADEHAAVLQPVAAATVHGRAAVHVRAVAVDGMHGARGLLQLPRRLPIVARPRAVLTDEEEAAVKLVVTQRVDRGRRACRVGEVDERVALGAARWLGRYVDADHLARGAHHVLRARVRARARERMGGCTDGAGFACTERAHLERLPARLPREIAYKDPAASRCGRAETAAATAAAPAATSSAAAVWGRARPGSGAAVWTSLARRLAAPA